MTITPAEVDLGPLQRSSRRAAFITIAAVLVVAATLAFAAFRLSRLQHEEARLAAAVADKQEELTRLETRNAELARATEAAQLNLERINHDVAAALAALDVAKDTSLSSAGKAAVDTAINQVSEAKHLVVQTGNALERSKASPAVEVPGANRDLLIEQLFSARAGTRLRAYDEIMRRHSRDPELVPALLSYARANRSNADGIYNTLVVLAHVDARMLRPHVREIESFAASVESMGPRIADRVKKLRARVPR